MSRYRLVLYDYLEDPGVSRAILTVDTKEELLRDSQDIVADLVRILEEGTDE